MPQLSGFVVLHRSLLSWGWHADPATGWLFVNLILLANCAPAEWKGIKIERGQLIAGRKSLAAQTGLSERQIRTALEHLKTTNEVTIKATNKFSLITIVNYRKFQDYEAVATSKTTSKTPTTDQQPTTTKPEEQESIVYTVADAPPPTKKLARFVPPAVEEVSAYCRERGNKVDAQRFVDHYSSNGWKVGRNSMKDWRAAVRVWEKNDSQQKAVSSFDEQYAPF